MLPAAAVISLKTAFSRSSNSLLELAAKFRAGNQRAHVEGHEPLVAQTFRYVAIHDAKRQTFGDRGLADARLADQNGIVLRAARQYLDRAADFLVAADDGVELAGSRKFRQIPCIFLERVIAVFRRRRIGTAALTQFLDRIVEVLRTDIRIFEDAPGLGAARHRQREEKQFGSHVTVARFFCQFLGGVEQPCRVGRNIHLPCARAFHARELGQRNFRLLAHQIGAAAGSGYQPRCKTFLIVHQHLQQVQRIDGLIVGTDCKALRRLNEPARPLGKLLDVHICLSGRAPAGSRCALNSVRPPMSAATPTNM
jgi:hypothetical protein